MRNNGAGRWRVAFGAAWMALAAGWAGAQRVEVPFEPEPRAELLPQALGAPASGPKALQFLGIPSEGWVKVTVPLQALEAFLASPAGATATLASEGLAAHVFRIDAREAQSAAALEGVDVRADFHQIWLRRGMLDTRAGGRGVDGARHPRFLDRGFALVQLQGPVDDASLDALRATGVELVHYLPQNAYLVWIADAASRARLVDQVGDAQRFAFVDAFLPEDALSPLLDGARGLVEVVVQVHNTEAVRTLSPADRPAVAEVLGFATEELFAPEDVLGGLYTNLTLRLPAEALATLVELERVVNIEPYAPRELLSERQAQEIRGFWNAAGTGANGPGYLNWLLFTKFFPVNANSYPIVSVVDGGVDNGTTSPLDPSFYTNGGSGSSRIVAAFNFTDSPTGGSITGHGNHCASILGGYESTSTNLDGGLYLRGLGVNPFGRISNVKVFNDGGAGIFGTNTQHAQKSIDHGATISSNSWGNTGVYGTYNSYSQNFDALTRDAGSAAGNQQLLFVFAAGNSGTSGINAPGTAKNVLTVGASEGSDNTGTDGCGEGPSSADNIQQVASFSGRGPTTDGRAKPELVVPGTHVVGRASQMPGYTGISMCNPTWPVGQTTYSWGSGTSFAAPAVSGAASLFVNYLSRLHSISNPSPALLKAFALHQTRFLNAAPGSLPNSSQGYGTTWLDFAFDDTVARRFSDQSTAFNATGEYRYYTGTIADAMRPFRIALAWTDAPGSTFGSAWANDLDLTVTVGGNTYRGNVFLNALSTTGGSADTKNNYELVVLPNGLAGTVTVRVSATNIAADGVPGNADATDQDFALVMANVNLAAGCTPAEITTNLSANSTALCAGSPLVLSVAASGSGLSYKFYRNGNTVQQSSSNTYTVSSATTNDTGTYTCLVTNSCGEALSAPVAVVVNTVPVPTQQPVGVSQCQGTAAALTFVASGTPAPTYQWKLNGNNVAGATSSTYSISSLQPSNGGTYTCVATNACGFVTSNATVVTVLTNPVFSTQPQNTNACAGSNVVLTSALSNATPQTTYIWLRNNVQVNGATSPVLTLNAINANQAGTYACLATNGCGFQFSAQAVVNVYTTPVISTHPQSQTYCAGAGFVFGVGVSNTTPTPSYQWRFNGNPIAGATNSTYGQPSGQQVHVGTYDCVVTNSCGSTTSNPATFSLHSPSTITQQPVNVVGCSGAQTLLTLQATGSQPMAFDWYFNGNLLSSTSSPNLTIFNTGPGNVGNYFCRVRNVCANVDSNVVTLSLGSSPAITSHPVGTTVCAPTPVSLSVSATGTPSPTFQWYHDGNPILGATGAQYSIPSTTGADSGNYHCVATTPCGSATSNLAAVVVNEAPVIAVQPVGVAACVGQPVQLSLVVSSVPTPTFQWRRNGAPLAGAVSSSYSIPSYSASLSGSYDCLLTSSCGVTTSAIALVVTSTGDTCVTGGPGGGLPAPGAIDGLWPNQLPTGALVSSLPITVPAGATRISAVRLLGLLHSWSGDCQIVLETPNGTLINLFQQVDGVYGGGCDGDFSGDYTFVDASATQGSCGSAVSTFACNPAVIAPGTYRQFFGAWPDGAAGISNVGLGGVPVTSGTYTLRIYDWYVPGDNGSLAGWEVCFDSTPTCSCSSDGAGGAWPASGAVDGSWPTVLPTGALVSSLPVTLPAGATRITSVKLGGFGHSWLGDCQIVLETPGGLFINLFQQVDGVFSGGCDADFSGDYSFVDASASTDPCGGSVASFACTPGVLAPGTYRQHFGAWPSGAAGIDNLPLASVPVTSGTYRLHIYDWYVAGDNGSLADWRVCFDGESGPITYCTPGTTTSGCNATIGASANPSATLATPCVLTVSNVEGQKVGLVFYSMTGPNAAPWNGSTSFLCVKAPTQRTAAQNAGGVAGGCGGQLVLDWNAYQTANPGALGNPFAAGMKVWAQGWFRDPPAPGTTNLSNAVELTYVP